MRVRCGSAVAGVMSSIRLPTRQGGLTLDIEGRDPQTIPSGSNALQREASPEVRRRSRDVHFRSRDRSRVLSHLKTSDHRHLPL